MRILTGKFKSSFLLGLFVVNLVLNSLFLAQFLGSGGIQANNGDELPDMTPNPQTAEMVDPTTWWNENWDYRVRVEVNNTNTDIIKETPIEKRINFTNLLQQVSDTNRLDNKSIRVVEYTQSGQWVEMRSRWNATEDTANLLQYGSYSYNDNQDIFDITWTLNGTTQANQNRTFYIYFNSRGSVANVGLPNYGFDPYHLNYVDYRKIGDFSSGAMTRNDPWDREYWTIYNEWLKDPDRLITDNTTFNAAVSNLNYEGWVHQFQTGSGRQTHVGEVWDNPSGYRFPIQWSGASEWFITQYPIFTVTMRVDDPTALTAFYIYNNIGGWNITGYTPNSRDTQGYPSYNNGVDKVNGFEVICDGQWHVYAYDMRRVSLNPAAYISCIEMFQNTWSGNPHYIYMDNMFFYKSNVTGIDPLYSNYRRNLPTTWVGQAHVKSAALTVHCIDVDSNPIPNVNVTLVNSTGLTPITYNMTNAEGYTIFPGLSFGNYSFVATLHSNVVTDLNTIVNSTVGIENLTVNSLTPTTSLNCIVSRTVFTIKDVNGAPVEAGWVLTGNDTYPAGILNAPIGSDGKAYFYWYNVTPYTDFKYSFTVFYQNTSYSETRSGLDTIMLGAGLIESNNRTGFTLWTNLTTQYFSILSSSDLKPIPGAEIRITNSSLLGGGSVTNLTTDASGNAVFRWLIANETGGNSNYTFQIYFFGNAKNFNTTWGSATQMNATLNLTQYWEFRAIVDLSLYQTALVSLVPGGFIETEWGREIRVRVLFNVTKTSGEPTGPTWATSVNYQLRLGATVILSGALNQIPYFLGWYEAVINSSLLSSDSYYSLEVTGVKSGYTNPSPIAIPISITSGTTTLTKTSGPSTIDTFWNDTEAISVDLALVTDEQIDIQNILSQMAMSGKLSLWDLQNNWNLTKAIFNFDDVYWPVGTFPTESDRLLNVTAPDATIVVKGAIHEQVTPQPGYYNIRNLVFEKSLNALNNSYNFVIKGNFVGTISGNVTVYFQRNEVNATFKAEVATTDTSLSIKRFQSGWSINYLNITLSDISAPFSLGDIKIQLPTGVIYAVTPCGTLGCLEIIDLDLYPSNDSWVFGLSTGSRSFNVTIIAGMRQVVALHTLLETSSLVQTFSGIATDQMLEIAVDGSQFSHSPALLHVTNLVNASTGIPIYPENVNLQVTLGGVPYTFTNLQSPGESSVTLNTLPLAELLSYEFTINGGQSVYFNVTLEQSMTRSTSSATTGTITYLVREEPSVFGNFFDVSGVAGQYAVDLYTGVLDARSYTLQIRGAKANFATAALDLDLNIAQIYTRINGTTYFNRNRDIFKTEAYLFYVNYTDVYNLVSGEPTPITGAIATFNVGFYSLSDPNADDPLWTDSGTLSDLGNGIYELAYGTEFLEDGIYKFAISLSMARNVYEPRTANLNLRINLIPGIATIQTSLVQTKIQRQNATYSFLLTDGRSNHLNEYYPESLTNVGVVFTSTEFDATFMSWKNGTNNGIYNLTIDTRRITFGATYTLRVTFSRVNYTDISEDITLTVNAFYPHVTATTDLVSVIENQDAEVTISVTDSLPELETTFESIEINWNVTGTDLSGKISQVSTDGDYVIIFPTTSLAPNANYQVLITVNVTVGGVNYAYSSTVTVNVRVEYEQIFGIPRPYFWIMMIALVAIVGTLAIYRYVKYARIPQFVRDIQRVRSTIRKGKSVGRESITESRGESISKVLEARYAALGMVPSEKFAPKSSEEAGKAGGERKPEEEVA